MVVLTSFWIACLIKLWHYHFNRAIKQDVVVFACISVVEDLLALTNTEILQTLGNLFELTCESYCFLLEELILLKTSNDQLDILSWTNLLAQYLHQVLKLIDQVPKHWLTLSLFSGCAGTSILCERLMSEDVKFYIFYFNETYRWWGPINANKPQRVIEGFLIDVLI